MSVISSHCIEEDSAAQHGTREPKPRISICWLAAIIGAIVYGSFIPFTIDPSLLRFDNLLGVSALIVARPNAEDLVTNLLLYLPIGVAFHLSTLMRRRREAVRWAAAISLGFMLSLGIETVQTAIHGRVGSWIDVLLNTVSTGFAFLLSARGAARVSRVIASWPGRSIARPYRLLWVCAALGLMVYSLVPFDFTTSSADLHESFRRAALYPRAWVELPAGPPLWLMVISYLRDALAFAVVGYLGVLAAVEHRPGVRIDVGHHAIHTLTLIIVIELLQLLTRSRVFDVLDMAASQVCAVVGIRMASAVVRGSAFWIARWEPRRTFPTGILCVGVLAQALVLFGPAVLRASHANPAVTNDGLVFALPFEVLWRQPIALATSEIATQFVGFAALGLGVAILLRRSRIGAAWVISASAIVLAALTVTGVDALLTVRRVDFTSPLLALLAAILVSQTYPRLRAIWPHRATLIPD